MNINFRATALLVAYIASIVAGVWAVNALGVVPVGFGLMAPAAVYFVGLTLVLRDLIHELGGVKLAIGAVIVGALLSSLINPGLALASGIAFLVSESLDLLVYDQIRVWGGGTLRGVVLSNAISIPIDSLLFLTLAFGSLAFFPGQVLGKALATAAAVLVLAAIRLGRTGALRAA